MLLPLSGPALLGGVKTPTPIQLQYRVQGANLDGQYNRTLVDGGSLSSVVNLGLRGGLFTPPLAAPKFKLLPNGFGSILFAGGDRLVSTAGAAIAEPYTVVLVVKRTIAETQFFIDGLAFGNRCFVFDNGGGASLVAGAGAFTMGAPFGTTINEYNVVVAYLNGASSSGYLNFPFDLPTVTGDAGSQAPTGFTLGAALDGTAPLRNGELVDLLVYSGIVDVQTIQNFIDTDYCVGWPKSNLIHFNFGAYDSPLFPATGGDKIVFFGNSLTVGTPSSLDAWMLPYEATLNASVSKHFTFVNKGIGGNTVQDLLNRVQTDVINLNPQPQGVIIECVINDFFQRVPLDVFINNGQTLISQIKAGIPGVHGAWLDALCRGEYFPDPVNLQINQYCNAIAYLCSINGFTHAPVRSAQQAAEKVLNVPPPGALSGILTSDGAHCNRTAGAPLMSNVMFQRTLLKAA